MISTAICDKKKRSSLHLASCFCQCVCVLYASLKSHQDTRSIICIEHHQLSIVRIIMMLMMMSIYIMIPFASSSVIFHYPCDRRRVHFTVKGEAIHPLMFSIYLSSIWFIILSVLLLMIVQWFATIYICIAVCVDVSVRLYL